MNWKETGDVERSALADERLQLHYGAYLLASAAHSILPHEDDDSHSNLELNADHMALVTRSFLSGFTLQLNLVPFEIVVCRGGVVKSSTLLTGQSVDQVLGWIERALGSQGLEMSVARRNYPDFPESPLMQSGVFSSAGEAERRELGHWFANAQQLIDTLGSSESAMSAPRIWPHHFDLGALIPVSEDGSRSIGLGFSPGDAQIPEPYFYCSPYPAPDAATTLPPMPAGEWTREGFTSAILTATEIQASGSQSSCAQSYLEAAVAGCRVLIDSNPSTSSEGKNS